MEENRILELDLKIEEYVNKVLDELFGTEKNGRLEGLSWLKIGDRKTYFNSLKNDEKQALQRERAKEILTTIVRLEVYHENINKNSKNTHPQLLQIWGKAKLKALSQMNKLKSEIAKKKILGFSTSHGNVKTATKNVIQQLYSSKEAKKTFEETSLASFLEGIGETPRITSKIAMSLMECLKSGQDIRSIFDNSEEYENIKDFVAEEREMLQDGVSSKKGFIDYQREYTKTYNDALDFVALGDICLCRGEKANIEKIMASMSQLFKDAIIKGGGDRKSEKDEAQEVFLKLVKKIRGNDGKLNLSNEDLKIMAQEALDSIDGVELMKEQRDEHYAARKEANKNGAIVANIIRSGFAIGGVYAIANAFKIMSPGEIAAYSTFVAAIIAGGVTALKHQSKKIRESRGRIYGEMLKLDLSQREEIDNAIQERLKAIEESQKIVEKEGQGQAKEGKEGLDKD